MQWRVTAIKNTQDQRNHLIVEQRLQKCNSQRLCVTMSGICHVVARDKLSRRLERSSQQVQITSERYASSGAFTLDRRGRIPFTANANEGMISNLKVRVRGIISWPQSLTQNSESNDIIRV